MAQELRYQFQIHKVPTLWVQVLYGLNMRTFDVGEFSRKVLGFPAWHYSHRFQLKFSNSVKSHITRAVFLCRWQYNTFHNMGIAVQKMKQTLCAY